MSILSKIKSLFRPITVMQLAASELDQAKRGLKHVQDVREYVQHEIFRNQTLLDYAEATENYHSARIERLEVMLYGNQITDCTGPMKGKPNE